MKNVLILFMLFTLLLSCSVNEQKPSFRIYTIDPAPINSSNISSLTTDVKLKAVIQGTTPVNLDHVGFYYQENPVTVTAIQPAPHVIETSQKQSLGYFSIQTSLLRKRSFTIKAFGIMGSDTIYAVNTINFKTL